MQGVVYVIRTPHVSIHNSEFYDVHLLVCKQCYFCTL